MSEPELHPLAPRPCAACAGARRAGAGACPACAGRGVRPLIELDPRRVICPWHGEPFRARWPSGYAPFAWFGLERLLRRDDVARAAGGRLAEVERLLDARPLCCRLGDDELLALYLDVQAAAPTWAEGRCEQCRRVALGGPYQRADSWGRIVRHAHVCLECVVRRKTISPNVN